MIFHSISDKLRRFAFFFALFNFRYAASSHGSNLVDIGYFKGYTGVDLWRSTYAALQLGQVGAAAAAGARQISRSYVEEGSGKGL